MIVNNLNPCNLLDALTKNNIQVKNNCLKSDLVIGETIAKNITVELINAENEEKVKEIIKNLDNTTVVKASEQEQINGQLLEEIAQQKIVNAQLIQEIASLKGGNANV